MPRGEWCGGHQGTIRLSLNSSLAVLYSPGNNDSVIYFFCFPTIYVDRMKLSNLYSVRFDLHLQWVHYALGENEDWFWYKLFFEQGLCHIVTYLKLFRILLVLNNFLKHIITNKKVFTLE